MHISERQARRSNHRGVRVRRKYIPADYVGLTSLGVSILLGVIAIAVTDGFHGYGWGIVLTGVVGVAQTVYTLVNQAFSGKLSKDEASV
nr:hypothetical protein [Bifidobacterium leontopitheci]